MGQRGVHVAQDTAKKLFGAADAGVNFRYTAGPHGRAEVHVIEIKVIGRRSADGKEEVRSVKAPIWALPGHADGAITVHLGLRPRASRQRRGPVVKRYKGGETQHRRASRSTGSTCTPLRSSSGGLKFADRDVGSSGQGGPKSPVSTFLACTQGH